MDKILLGNQRDIQQPGILVADRNRVSASACRSVEQALRSFQGLDLGLMGAGMNARKTVLPEIHLIQSNCRPCNSNTKTPWA